MHCWFAFIDPQDKFIATSALAEVSSFLSLLLALVCTSYCLCKLVKAEARAWRLDWQKQAEEASAHEEKAREELRTWQERAIASERDTLLRRIAEQEVANSELKAEQEEHWRKRWQEKAEIEEKLRDSWQHKAKTLERDCQQWQTKAKEQDILLKEEVMMRQKAEKELLYWHEKAKSEESCRKRFEEERQELQKRLEEEESLRRQCEQLAEKEQCLRKQWHSTGNHNKRRRIDEHMQIERDAKEKALSALFLSPSEVVHLGCPLAGPTGCQRGRQSGHKTVHCAKL